MPKHKYNAKPTVIEGKWFASRREARDYQTLLILEKAGKITNLRLQVRFPLEVNGVLVTTYVADFVYREVDTDMTVVADSKGVKTDVYKIKKKLMKLLRGIDILEL